MYIRFFLDFLFYSARLMFDVVPTEENGWVKQRTVIEMKNVNVCFNISVYNRLCGDGSLWWVYWLTNQTTSNKLHFFNDFWPFEFFALFFFLFQIQTKIKPFYFLLFSSFLGYWSLFTSFNSFNVCSSLLSAIFLFFISFYLIFGTTMHHETAKM